MKQECPEFYSSESGDSQKSSKSQGFSDAYFQPKPWESEQLYRAFGVRGFQKILKVAPIYRKRDRSIDEIYEDGKFAEGWHATNTLLLGLVSVIAAYDGALYSALALTVLNVALNIYPVMSQRYNRIRLNRVIHKS